MIEVFKIMTGKSNIDRSYFFSLNNNRHHRGHGYKIYKEKCRVDLRKYSFSHRVVNEWNDLPGWVVDSSSVNNFKNNIDRFYKGRFV